MNFPLKYFLIIVCRMVLMLYILLLIPILNGLAESLIKRLQLIARPLLLRTKLPLFAWEHPILHAATLIQICPTANHDCLPLQLVLSS